MSKLKSYTILMKNIKNIGRLIGFSKGHKVSYLFALVTNATTIILFNFFIGKSIELITDSVFEQKWEQLKWSILFAFVAIIVNASLEFASVYCMMTRVPLIMKALKSKVLEHILALPTHYYESNHSGQLQSRLTNDLQQAEQCLSFPLVEPLNRLTLGIGNIVFIGLISWKLALISVGLCIVVLTIFYLYIEPVNKTSEEIQGAIARSTSRLSDFIKGESVIKMFGLQRWAKNRIDKENEAIMTGNMKLLKIDTLQLSLNELNHFISTFLILGIGSLFLATHQIKPGGLLAISRYTASMVSAFLWFGSTVIYLQEISVGASRIFEILDTPCEEDKSAKKIDSEAITIEFKDFSFRYPNQEADVLQHVNLKILPKQMTALVGKSGSGKTTLIKLLMKLYTIEEGKGELLLNQEPIENYSGAEIRKSIAYVSKRSYLFHGTIRDNISLGKEGATEEEIIGAAKAACAHEFIMELPKGYDTPVGSGGTTLSGGQCQRISIARALLKDAPIIIFDEPTSALDADTERVIQKTMDNLKKDKTIIIVAHRLSTIQNAEQIVEIR